MFNSIVLILLYILLGILIIAALYNAIMCLFYYFECRKTKKALLEAYNFMFFWE